MKRQFLYAVTLLFLVPPIHAQNLYGHDVVLTDVSKPQARYQIVPDGTAIKVAAQQQAMEDIAKRIDSIEQSLKDIKADIKVLQETNVLVKFLLGCAKLLIPGLLIATFVYWLSNRPKRGNEKPRGGRPAHSVGL